MKSLIKKLIFLSITFISLKSSAQSVTANVLTTPCNCNGEIEFVFTGFTAFPIDISYKVNGVSYTKSINTTKDTLRNVCQGSVLFEAGNNVTQEWTYFYNNYNIFTVTNVNITAAICPGLGAISATVTGGVSPLTYSCKDVNTGAIIGTTNPIAVPAGEYIYTVKDASGCTYNIGNDSLKARGDTIIVRETSNINYTINTTPASCTNGTAAISGITGGVAPYVYLWSNGASTSSISSLILGSYKVTISDAQGCKTDRFFYIYQNPTIATNYTASPATCVQSDGSLMGFGSGGQNPYTYQWSTGATTQGITGLPGGNYTFTVTDKNGCLGKGYANVTVSTPIIVNYSTTPSACTSATGSATLNITGGSIPYTTTWFLSPLVTGSSITSKPQGSYNFQVVDNVGCVQSGTILIPQISTPLINLTPTHVICPSVNGAMSSSVSGVGPFTYLWNTGATTANITGSPGFYTLTVTDANSCKNSKYGGVESYPGFSVGVSSTNVSCIYSKDGSATAVATGTGPYTYSWSNGGTSSAITGIGKGSYWVTAKKANGCSASDYVNIENNATSDACYCTIKGKVYHDANNNCTLDAGETGIENIAMHLKGFGYTYTDANGDYTFQAPTGTYVLSQEVKSIFPMSSCQTKEYNVTVTAASGCSQTFNYADSLIPSHDLFIATMRNYNSAVVPGEIYTQRLLVKNIGNVTEANGKIGYKHDNQLLLLNPSSELTKTSGIRIDQSASFPSLSPNSISNSFVHYQVPTNMPINTIVVFNDTIAKALPLSTEWLEDMSPWNNVNDYNDICVSSYDPNSKEVLPRGTGPKGIVPKTTKQLTYTIHFQNLGTYYAKKVELIDTLDRDLDMSSLSPITASHKFETFIDDNGVVKFLFDKIYLPCEKDGGDASNGFVTYTINLRKDLPEGTEITNFADIYFDYNEPIRTNKAYTTIETTASISSEKNELEKSSFTIYPNPASDKFSTEIKANQQVKNASMMIFDLQGKAIYEWKGALEKGENTKEFNTEKLVNGIYIINLELNDEKLTRKLVIGK
jgi:uncharacterized repeat protein (TIGR01451 family)